MNSKNESKVVFDHHFFLFCVVVVEVRMVEVGVFGVCLLVLSFQVGGKCNV